MSTNKIFPWALAVLLAFVFSAVSAIADTQAPTSYLNLTAVEMAPSKAPRLNNGLSDLGRFERRFEEKLPVQLAGSIRKIEKAKYKR